MNIIFSIDSEGGYSKNNALPWASKEDMKHFKDKTIHQVVIMGRKTWESLPKKPLPDRINIVLSTTLTSESNAIVCKNLNLALQVCRTVFPSKLIFIIGGKDLILETLIYHQFTSFYLTVFHGSYACDQSIPIERERFQVVNQSEIPNAIIYELKANFYNEHDITYNKLLTDILKKGEKRIDRTGTGTLSKFSYQYRFDISKSVPLLTTKKMAWKTCIKELLWFLNGDTDVQKLRAANVHIWDGNTNREFLDKIGLYYYDEWDMGPGYGFQWRHFGAIYKGSKINHDGYGVDQLNKIVEQLKNEPFSRRIILSAWNPVDIHKMALPPCHVMCQFYVSERDGKKLLSCHMFQRSQDVFLGAPFNIFSYCVLTYILAKKTGMKPHELIISTGDTHIYLDHIEQVKEQLSRIPYPSPKLEIDDSIINKDWKDISISDFKLSDYQCNPPILALMSA
jgi:thymidylate synthase